MQCVIVIILHGKQLSTNGKQFAQMAMISIPFIEPNHIFLLSSHFSLGWEWLARGPLTPKIREHLLDFSSSVACRSPKPSGYVSPGGPCVLRLLQDARLFVVWSLNHPGLPLEPLTLLQFPQRKSLVPYAHGFNRIYWRTEGTQARSPHILLSKQPKHLLRRAPSSPGASHSAFLCRALSLPPPC